MKKWIMDESETNLINPDFIERIYFEDRGSDYKLRYRVMAESDSMNYVLCESCDEGLANEIFMDFYHDLSKSESEI